MISLAGATAAENLIRDPPVLDCSYEDDYSLFGHVGARPQRVGFSRG